jgi:hypothetical protein
MSSDLLDEGLEHARIVVALLRRTSHVLKLLVRCVLFLCGLAMLADVVLPGRTEQLTVDRHSSRLQGGPGAEDTTYEVHLAGGVVHTCSVGYVAYSSLKDGDAVEVRSTRLWRACTRMTRSGEVVLPSGYWWLVTLFGGCILVAAAIGWLKGGDGDDDGIGIRLD